MHSHLTAGIDEVGTGSFTHPTVICCCVLGYNIPNGVVKDSKKFSSEKKRSESFLAIIDVTLYCKTYFVYQEGNFKASLAHAVYDVRKAFPGITVVIDGNNNYGLDAHAVVKADSSHTAVAAASIVAKVRRDIRMNNTITTNDYGFSRHKGYGTPEHLAALKAFGPLEGIHRMNIQAVKDSVK